MLTAILVLCIVNTAFIVLHGIYYLMINTFDSDCTSVNNCKVVSRLKDENADLRAQVKYYQFLIDMYNKNK